MSDVLRTLSSAYRSALGRVGLLGSQRRSPDDRVPGSSPRGRLFRKYVLLIVGLVSLVLLLNSALDFWFSYEENKAALFRIQQEKAGSAARRIEQFVDEIERQLGWTTAPQWAASPLDQRRFDYVRLLRQAPAITELIQLDDAGKEQLKVSRLAMDVVGSEKDYSQSPSFTEAKQHRAWFSPVYFRKESEPYMTVALARAGRNAGVTVAEVNLKLIWDVITGLKIGQSGYAYVVDREGRLIAHPDISLVLRNTDLANLPQVASALAEAPSLPSPAGGGGSGWGQPIDQAAMVAKGINGNSVLTAHAAIAPLGWTVFVELPLSEALAPLYGSALRTAALLALALVLATSAALLLARRMTVPIRQLQAGAARIGAGELNRHIDIQTGDELEDLAGDFNRMAADLQKSYADLEKKVEDRTTELKEALEQQTATAEVLGVINSSPGDLAPVFDATLEKALTLCDASFGQLVTFDGISFRAAAWRGYEPGPNATTPTPGMALYELVHGERVVHIPDITADDVYRSGNAVRRRLADQYGARTAIWVALKKDSALLGAFVIYRTEVRPFTDKQIALLQNFAAQAVIAMENARLLTETREALEQQTATAEVLQVINSSPGDLVPVFQAIVEKAHTLCGAACGSLQLWDGEKFRGVAMRGFSEAMVEQLRLGYSPSDMPCQRLVEGGRVVHCVDLAEIDSPVAREGGVKLGGIRTILYVAMRKDDVLLGQIVAARQEVRPFSEKEIALVESFAAQAVIAMENARLITETREALQQQTATAEVLGVINSSPGELAPVFDAMLERALNLCEATIGALGIFDGQRFDWLASRDAARPYAESIGASVIPLPGLPLGRIADGEEIVHIQDVAEIDELLSAGPGWRRFADSAHPRTALWIALRKDSALLGAIVIWRQEVRPFTDKQIALLQNFAAQAVIAMENARLINQTREALEQQTATAEVLGVINSSPGDLAPVFDAMLDKALTLCEAVCGQLATFDGEFFEFVALKGDTRWLGEHPRGRLPPSRALTWPRIVNGEPFVQIADAQDTEYYRSGQEQARDIAASGGRTFLTVALRREHDLRGALTVYRQEVRPFSDKQIALLQNFAAQAVIAMENARLITETREALEQQTATAEVLGVINSSPGDLAPVFDAMLDKAMRLCEAAFGTLWTYDGACVHAAALHNVPPVFAEFLTRAPHQVGPESAHGRLLRGEPVVHIPDIVAENAYRLGDPIRRALVELGGGRTLLAVPLRKDNTFLGDFVIYRQEARPFSDKQIALLQNFAAQAVIAMENARLITETREALEQQTATAQVLGVINSSPGDLGPVFDAILEKAHTLCGAAHGSLGIFEGETWRAVVQRGYGEPLAERLRQGVHRSDNEFLQGLIDGARFVHIPDLARLDYPIARANVAAGIHTLLVVPLRKEDALLGTISTARREVRAFTDKEIALLENFAAQAVIAMENARLITETREALEQQTATAEVLQVINSSPGDLAPVFEAMLEKAHTLCGAAHGSLQLYDGENLHAVATHAVSDKFADILRQGYRAADSLASQALVEGEPFAHIADCAQIDHPVFRSAAELAGIHTVLFVPLRKDGAFLGLISAARLEVRPFSEKEIALLQNFAAQAVIAMENARLITETREALEQQTATAEVLGVINSSPGDVQPTFDAIATSATRLCEAASGAVSRFDGSQSHLAAHYNCSPAELDALRATYPLAPSRGSVTGRAILTRAVAHVADIATDREYALPSIVQSGMHAHLSVPMLLDGLPVGAITVARREAKQFSETQIELLKTFAAQAVIAMENARLITETREALEQQTATAEVLQVINSSPGDLAPVFEAMLERAMRLCGGSFGVFATYQGEHYRVAATRGLPPGLAELVRDPIAIQPGSMPERLRRGEDTIQVPDITALSSELRTPGLVAMTELGNAHTAVWVALRKDGVAQGFFGVYRQEVRPFSDKQIGLLQNFAAQAVIAMENARLITETREALEQQTATAEVLQVINSSPGELAPVFEAMLDKALDLCEAAFGLLHTYDGERFRALAVGGVSDAEAEPLREWVPDAGSALERIVLGDRVVHIPDVVDTEAYRSGVASRVKLVQLTSARTALWVALRKDDVLLGVFVIYRKEVRPFSEKQIALLENFAAQAVIAMENARLLTETREALEYQTATSEVLRVVSRSAFDLDTVLHTVVATAIRLCRADSAVIYRNDDGEYRWAAGHMLSPEYEEIERNVRIQPGTGTVVGRAALEGATVQILDAWTDTLYEAKDDARVGGVHTMIGVPLLREGAPIGVIGLARRRVEAFSEREIQLVTTFADQAVIAIENARLITELRQRTRDLQESLEYQTATSNVLKVISQSGAELEPVLKTLVETAARICEADSGFIFRLHEGLCRMVASFGIPGEYRDIQERNPIAPSRGTLAGRTVLEQRVVHIEDAATDSEYTRAEAVQLGRQRTMLGVPLIREDALIGVITLARSHVEPFTDKQIGLVTTFADQAVIAIENARLFGELRARTEELGSSVAELKMLSEVGQAVSSTLDLRAVLSTILNASLGVTWANAGAIFRYIRAERAFRLVEAVGWDEPLVRSVRDLRVAEAETAMGEAAARRTPIQLAELAERPSAPLRDASLAAGFHSALIVPLVGAERILGAIILMRQEAGEFPAETVRLMQTLASQSVLAIQNARLFREIADKSEQLALASQHKSQFLANMSHELRTPLNAILGYAELLVDGIYGVLPDRPKGVLDRIQNNGKHLLALINDVLDLAKIEAGQLTLTLEDYSVPEVVKSVVTATEPLATSKGLKFTAALQDDLPMAHGDARRVSQVLLNLVGNAIKFTDKGEVEIRAIVDKVQFVLTVRDTGPGIADADQERIFGEFQQIDNSNTRKKGGTGLGLAISKRMVEMQGGTISVESVLGQGSTFRVLLPVHVDEMMEAA